MDTPPKLLYPSLVIAAISVTSFSLLGIATLTGHYPLAGAAAEDSPTPSEPLRQATLTEAGPVAAVSTHAAAQPPRLTLPAAPTPSAPPVSAPVAATCANCGTVESIASVERQGDGTGLGAVAGGVTGALLGSRIGKGHGSTGMAVLGGAGGAYVGNRIEQNMRRSTAWRINVRMSDGRLRTLYQREAPVVAIGRQVEIVGNSIVPLG